MTNNYISVLKMSPKGVHRHLYSHGLLYHHSEFPKYHHIIWECMFTLYILYYTGVYEHL